jgi:hypothetical protein
VSFQSKVTESKIAKTRVRKDFNCKKVEENANDELMNLIKIGDSVNSNVLAYVLPQRFFPLFLRPDGPVAQLNRASDYGSEGFRFES